MDEYPSEKKFRFFNTDDEEMRNILILQKTTGYKHRIGTRGFLAPEIILNSRIQTRSVDIWAAGVIMLGLFAKRMPVFNMNKFSKITAEVIRELEPLLIIFGKDKIYEICEKYSNIFKLL